MVDPITGAAEAAQQAAWKQVAAMENLTPGTTWVAAEDRGHTATAGSRELQLLLGTCRSVSDSDHYSRRVDSARAQILLLPDGRVAAVSERRHWLHQRFTLHYMGNSLDAAATAANAALLDFEATGMRPRLGSQASFFDARMVGFAIYNEFARNRPGQVYSGHPVDLKRQTGLGVD